MPASVQDLMTAKLFFNAAFPVMQVVLEDDSSIGASFRHVQAVVQIGAKNPGGEEGFLACHLRFDNGALSVIQGPAEKADIALTFSSVAAMNTMFRGGLALPAIRGFFRLPLLVNVFRLLMSLMLMMPKSRPAGIEKQRLKVKMCLYMITRALSNYNKLGDPAMVQWCKSQPDRIYQFTVDDPASSASVPGVSCYLRVKAGKTKSGHGVYTRRSPFVLFHFFSVEGALKVLLRDVGFVQGVEQGCVEIVGSPEYAMHLNDFMSILQDMLT